MIQIETGSASMNDTLVLTLPLDKIREYCASQPIRRLYVFGSAARNELTPESDIDLLVEYEPGAPVGLFAMARQMREFSEICGRDVDLCTPNGLSKYIRDEVIASAKLIYETADYDDDFARVHDLSTATIVVAAQSAIDAKTSYLIQYTCRDPNML